MKFWKSISTEGVISGTAVFPKDMRKLAAEAWLPSGLIPVAGTAMNGKLITRGLQHMNGQPGEP
ncbi:MAG: hypothetical protein IT166_00490 [Bryobacterales bacterium]|nr:hypothetical protein [Bryobacterales bacterium]